MSVIITLDYRLKSQSPAGQGLGSTNTTSFAPGAGTGGARLTVSLPGSTYTALSVPSGSKLLLILLGSAVSLVLKGASGDTGIPITPSSNPLQADCILTLGASPAPGILNNSASTQVVEVIWV